MTETIWVIIGITSNILFSLRFIIQWITSEKQKTSVLPKSFWYLSVAGSIGILSYALHKKDVILMIPPFFGIIVYVRNIILIHK